MTSKCNKYISVKKQINKENVSVRKIRMKLT